MVRYLKMKINSGPRIDPDQLWEKVRLYSCVSFDLFDTILKRNAAEPADVFSWIEEGCRGRFPGFRGKRIQAEQEARAASPYEEVTLEEIYRSYPGLSPAEREELADRELSAERLFITVSPEMLLLYRRCREAGKRVFFISDIYLPEAFMTELLSAFGLQDCDGLYVSSR
ncbi:MAG: hypothetical protein K6E30_06710, partial [Lachnospiraceae bacterium]|nr:hypothetical protein [Lachnospiraceae bacterium]